jgi:hypothetical protein
MANRRVQMDLSDKSFERLSKLKEKLEAVSYTEVMKDALRLLEYVVELDDAGAKFMVSENGQGPVEVKIL